MYRIGEFANRVGRSASTVRRWERRGRGLAVDEWIREVGTLVTAHEDRLARFGFDYLEHLASKNSCAILVANQESLSPREELVQDLLAIVRAFSSRLSGSRKYEKLLKSELSGGAR